MRTITKEPLSNLDGKPIDGHLLHIKNITQGRVAEEINFELHLKKKDGETSKRPVVKGTYFSGRGEFYTPWMEIYYNPSVKIDSSQQIDLSERTLDEKLFRQLSDILPPGSHIMVPYVDHEETREGLQKGIPAAATPLGYLLWRSGCTSFKDWYFSEGFREGDIKLQGNKPPDKENRRRDLIDTRKELTHFLKREKGDEKLSLDARKRAETILNTVKKELEPQ